MITQLAVEMAVHFVIQRLELNHGSSCGLYPAFQFFHEGGAKSPVLMVVKNEDLSQVVGNQVEICAEITHAKAKNGSTFFQKQTQGIFTAPYLMDALVSCVISPCVAVMGVVISYVMWNNAVDISFGHNAVLHGNAP